MKSPTFLEIWNDADWFNYWMENQPARTREYYKFRSAVRMAVWIPIFTFITYFSLAAISVLS